MGKHLHVFLSNTTTGGDIWCVLCTSILPSWFTVSFIPDLWTPSQPSCEHDSWRLKLQDEVNMIIPAVRKNTGGSMCVTALTLQTVYAYAKALPLGIKGHFLVQMTSKYNIKFKVSTWKFPINARNFFNAQKKLHSSEMFVGLCINRTISLEWLMEYK